MEMLSRNTVLRRFVKRQLGLITLGYICSLAKRMMLRKLSLLTCAFASCCAASTVLATSLCKSDETLYFSCKVNNSDKMISLCGRYPSNVFDSDDPDALVSREAFLVYRFGTEQKLELEYPQNRKDSLKKFEGVSIHSYFGDTFEVYFRNGRYSYGVFAGEGENFSTYGVRIFIGGTIDSANKTISCQNGTTIHSLWNLTTVVLGNFGGLVVGHPANVSR